MTWKLSFIAASMLIAGGLSANATEIDLSTLVNTDLNTYSGGSNYPANGGALTVGGIGFNLAAYPGGGTGIIQLSGDTTDMGGANPPFQSPVSIPVGLSGVVTVYTLINSIFGSTGTQIGTLDFIGSSSSYIYTLTEGSNVRDHYQDGFVNTAPGVAATANFGPDDRLDMQAIVLPGGLGTLELITFTATDPYYGNGEPFLAGVTTSTSLPAPTPLPSTWTMLIAGFAGLGFFAFRGTKKSSAALAAA